MRSRIAAIAAGLGWAPGQVFRLVEDVEGSPPLFINQDQTQKNFFLRSQSGFFLRSTRGLGRPPQPVTPVTNPPSTTNPTGASSSSHVVTKHGNQSLSDVRVRRGTLPPLHHDTTHVRCPTPTEATPPTVPPPCPPPNVYEQRGRFFGGSELLGLDSGL